ncbi:hypothetical protein AB0L20_32210 [Streptomyces albidoflavus]|uniref:hypothetical protein n=1 Tax=Streptomyces albidoflavus TaxID=1886 RepID=UPI00341394A1
MNLNSGQPWPSYLLQHGFLLASLVALVTMLGIVGPPMFGQVWVKLAIILTYIGVVLRYAWINAPKKLAFPFRSERDVDTDRHPPQME